MKPLILTAAPVAALAAMSALALAVPAAAQDAQPTGNERIMMVTIPAGDECPKSEDPDTIIVCDELDPGEQYRIPRTLRQSDSPENRSWAERVEGLRDIGASGPLSCTNIGGGSELGCTAKMIEDAYAEREQAPERRYSEQIDAARQERLATIDADAARTQARVEELERAYTARLEAERDAPLPGEESETLPTIEAVDPNTN